MADNFRNFLGGLMQGLYAERQGDIADRLRYEEIQRQNQEQEEQRAWQKELMDYEYDWRKKLAETKESLSPKTWWDDPAKRDRANYLQSLGLAGGLTDADKAEHYQITGSYIDNVQKPLSDSIQLKFVDDWKGLTPEKQLEYGGRYDNYVRSILEPTLPDMAKRIGVSGGGGDSDTQYPMTMTAPPNLYSDAVGGRFLPTAPPQAAAPPTTGKRLAPTTQISNLPPTIGVPGEGATGNPPPTGMPGYQSFYTDSDARTYYGRAIDFREKAKKAGTNKERESLIKQAEDYEEKAELAQNDADKKLIKEAEDKAKEKEQEIETESEKLAKTLTTEQQRTFRKQMSGVEDGVRGQLLPGSKAVDTKAQLLKQIAGIKRAYARIGLREEGEQVGDALEKLYYQKYPQDKSKAEKPGATKSDVDKQLWGE